MAQADSERAPLGACRRPGTRILIRLFPLMLLSLLVVLAIRAGLNFWYVTFDETYDVRHVTLADLTGDGHLDAFLSVGSIGDGYWRADRAMLNDGRGHFTDSGQELGEWRSFAAATGDVDGDGHVDAIVASYSGLMHYQNDGSGAFNTGHYDASMLVNGSWILNVALADLDEDGILDAFVTGCCGYIVTPNRRNAAGHSAQPREVQHPYSEVWLNDGAGGLVNNGQQIGRVGSNAVALGDLNGDGAVDAFLANGQTLIGDTGEQRIERFSPLRLLTCAISFNSAPNIDYSYETPNTIWFNDGQGDFSDSGQQLGRAESMAVSLGDVNGDGFLDAAVGNCGPDEIWFNDGRGNFSDSGQRLGRGHTWSVHMTDLDGDGDGDHDDIGRRVNSHYVPVRFGRRAGILIRRRGNPDTAGQLMRLPKWEDEPSYRDEYELVWMERPGETQRLVVQGHIPREHLQIFPSYLPDTSQLVFSSSQGVPLVSISDGEKILSRRQMES